ncbi:transmembrane protein 79 [Silurus meridionalis]|nr:transmembrane protein 79 [Silurus meridionalis]
MRPKCQRFDCCGGPARITEDAITGQQQEKRTDTERIHTHAEMEEEPVSGFHLELSGERGINERLEEEQRELEERTTGRESRTESERQDRSFAFIPLVKIVTKKDEKQTEGDGDVSGVDTCGGDVLGGDVLGGDTRGGDTGGEDVRNGDVSTNWENTKQTRWSRCECCGEMMSSVVFAVVGAVMFPLLVWGGHDLLPLDVPVVMSAPSRLVYTLRCALFATFPIILGVLVHGVSRLKFSSLNPLFEGKRASRHTLVHMAYVHDSLRLFLLFFLQLAVTSTYLQHHTLKLVPLLTIIFVFGSSCSNGTQSLLHLNRRGGGVQCSSAHHSTTP